MIFNPFEINDYIENPMIDIDPDFNFYKGTQYIRSTQCDYYLEDKFISEISCNESLNNSLSLFHMNIRSLPKYFDELEIYLESLKYQFSIIGITETRLNASNEESYSLKKYSSINEYRRGRKGGGVSLFVHDSIKYNRRTDLDFFDCEMETIFIELDKSIFSTKRNIILGLIYRMPDSSVKVFNERMESNLNVITREKKICYFMGDLNICFLKNESHKLTSDFIDIIYSYNVFPLISKPTRVTKTSATLIDH